MAYFLQVNQPKIVSCWSEASNSINVKELEPNAPQCSSVA